MRAFLQYQSPDPVMLAHRKRSQIYKDALAKKVVDCYTVVKPVRIHHPGINRSRSILTLSEETALSLYC